MQEHGDEAPATPDTVYGFRGMPFSVMVQLWAHVVILMWRGFEQWFHDG